jgi:tetratricopeptide (TPR) repeat protein
LLLLEAGLLLAPASNAQESNCGADDTACLTASYEAACRDPARSTAARCSAWLRRLETHTFADEPAWRLIAAAAYYSLAEMNDSPGEVNELRRQSAFLLRTVIAENPAGHYASEAYLGLSALSTDLDENIEHLRNAVREDPANAPAAEILAHLLASKGSRTERLEAAGLMQNAYANQRDSKRWYLAARAVALYEAAGALDRAQEFREQVYVDSEIEGVRDQLENIEAVDDSSSALSLVCNTYLVELFGRQPCMRGIETVVEAVKQENDPERQRRLAEAATAGMRLAINAPGISPAEKALFITTYKTFRELGIRSAKVEEAYSYLLEDPAEALSALAKAVDLEPENGRLVYQLALAYLEQEQWQKAIDYLERARPILPQSIAAELLEFQLHRAEEGLASTIR